MVENAPIIAIDTETTGLDWRRHGVIGWAIGDGRDGFYIPLRHGGGGNHEGGYTPANKADVGRHTAQFEIELNKALHNRRLDNKWTINHHMKFDMHMAWGHGVALQGKNISCTMNNAAFIDHRTPDFSLDGLAKQYGVEAKKGVEMYKHLAASIPEVKSPDKKAMEHFWLTNGQDPMVREYAIGDTRSAVQIFKKQLKQVNELDIRELFIIENHLISVLWRMERSGIAIDEEAATAVKAEIERGIDEARDALPNDFNSRSPKQVKGYVEQYRTDWPTTAKGNPSFTVKWLNTFKEGRHIVRLRQWTNLNNSFFGPLLTEHMHNGRVHTTLNQNRGDEYGTITGRLSCSRPNLQQVPKHNKELARLIRRCFKADDGYVLYERDYSQAEPRLFAHYSKDPTLLEGYKEGKDVHDMAATLLNADRDTVAKRMNMGIFTGMGVRALSGHMDIGYDEARDLFETWHSGFKNIRPFQRKAASVMKSRGYVKTLLGRRAYIEDQRFAYKAPSRIIQGGQADIMKVALVRMGEYVEKGAGVQMLMTVHDSEIDQVLIGDPKGAREVNEIMHNVYKELGLLLPIPVDVHHGNNWEEASFDKEGFHA